MATVFVADERLFVKDGENMSQERREELKLAAWSILVNRRQPDDLESVGEESESNRPVRFELLPRHGCSDREEDARRLERAANSDPTAALGERALQPVLSGRPINSEWLDFNSLSRYIDRPPEAEEVKLTDWGLSVTRYTDGRSVMSISRPKWKRQIGDRSPKLSSNTLLLMQENPYPMSIEDLCQAFMERFVKASDAEKECLWGTVETVVKEAITNLTAKLKEAGLLKNLERTIIRDPETRGEYSTYRLLGVLNSDNHETANR
jgi:hypothetical protein